MLPLGGPARHPDRHPHRGCGELRRPPARPRHTAAPPQRRVDVGERGHHRGRCHRQPSPLMYLRSPRRGTDRVRHPPHRKPAARLGRRLRSNERHTPGPADLAEASRAAGVRDERLLAAMAELPRAVFVPVELVARAYHDEPVHISHLQVTTQPSLVAKMVEALALREDSKVLEVEPVMGTRPPCWPGSPARSGAWTCGRT